MAGGTLIGGQAAYGDGTNSTGGANTITHYYDRAGLKAANEVNVYAQFADKKSMKQKHGKTFKISKWTHIYDRDITDGDFATKGFLGKRDLATTSAALVSEAGLSEGAGAVNQVAAKKITVECSFARFGEMIPYTDEVDLFSEDSVQVHNREELGRLANRRNEDLIQKDMLSTSTVLNANGAAVVADLGADLVADGSLDDNFRVSFDLVRKGARLLVRNRAKKNTSIVTGSTKVDTRTINKAFYSIVGPEVKFDLEGLERGSNNAAEFAYIPAYKYASATNLAEGECGAMHDVRFIESEAALMEEGAGAAIPTEYAGELSNNGANFDVFPMLFPTEGAFATVGLKGKGKIKFGSKAPESLELGNPYGTQGFFSYNFFYAGLIAHPEKLLRINVLATA